jgi:NadR type nicotinamide-nucleotide adenylyltransferase
MQNQKQIKIVVLGGESTGKSTLSSQLASHFKKRWVPEYARAFLENLGRPYTESDLLTIAKGQLELEDDLAIKATNILICDTDLHVVKVWSEYAYQRCDPFILNEIEHRFYDIYIITAPDFPWQPDPLREHPEIELRYYFFQLYCDLIAAKSIPYIIVRGNEKERLKQAIAFIENQFVL